jgi:predicted lactoylglutathione lyase
LCFASSVRGKQKFQRTRDPNNPQSANSVNEPTSRPPDGEYDEAGDPIDQESRSTNHRATTSVIAMTSIESVTLEVADPTAVRRFYTAAFGLDSQVNLRTPQAPTTGFRGFTLSLTVSQPATVDNLIDAALNAGATPLKPAAKSLWGYGGVIQAPDGTIWKIATSAKKDTGPATRQIDEIVLLLGVTDMAASKRFYVDHGLTVARSFGRKYVEFATASSPVKLALYGRRALAKDAGVPADGTGSHRIMIGSNTEPFTDPDGFAWETTSL